MKKKKYEVHVGLRMFHQVFECVEAASAEEAEELAVDKALRDINAGKIQWEDVDVEVGEDNQVEEIEE